VGRSAPEDAAGQALDQLSTQLALVAQELEHARTRALDLQAQRREGRSWYDIVSSEERPLIVEQVSSAMNALATAGGLWRRTQAQALHDENVSINRIADLYGVTRQRVSALLKGSEAAPSA
jgi:predicted XRE-type DNA-binding protein